MGQSVQSQGPLLGQLTAREEKKLLQRVAGQLEPRNKGEKQDEDLFDITMLILKLLKKKLTDLNGLKQVLGNILTSGSSP